MVIWIVIATFTQCYFFRGTGMPWIENPVSPVRAAGTNCRHAQKRPFHRTESRNVRLEATCSLRGVVYTAFSKINKGLGGFKDVVAFDLEVTILGCRGVFRKICSACSLQYSLTNGIGYDGIFRANVGVGLYEFSISIIRRPCKSLNGSLLATHTPPERRSPASVVINGICSDRLHPYGNNIF